MFIEVQEEISTHDYFRVDLQDRLPVGEIERRHGVKERLEAQYHRWETEERHSM